MRPGPVGWAMVLFLGAIAATNEGEAAPAAGERGGPAERRATTRPVAAALAGGGDGATEAAEARARWVLDRIEEEVAVIVGAAGSRAIALEELGAGAREGDVLDEELAPDPAATARARRELARLRQQLVDLPTSGVPGADDDGGTPAGTDAPAETLDGGVTRGAAGPEGEGAPEEGRVADEPPAPGRARGPAAGDGAPGDGDGAGAASGAPAPPAGPVGPRASR